MRRLFRRHSKKPVEEVIVRPSSLNAPQASSSQNTPRGSTSSNTLQAPAENVILQASSSISPQASTSLIVPQANTPGTHVCTSMCEGISGLPLDQHESIITQIIGLGGNPSEFKLTSLKLTKASWEGRRAMRSELDERRAIEGNRDLSRIPLASPTTYQYPPLPKGHARFIRPGALASHPVAWLESHSLENPPPYIAISYCWDASSPRRGMFLDMQSFSISETVLEVLNQVVASQHVRGKQKLLWIDQICINQDDPDEKLDQIYRMGEIYSKAETVFIWLGPTADNSDAALDSMPRMLEEVVAINEAMVTRTELPDDTAMIINADHGRNYGHLFSRQWFRRLWTVQEALLARQLVIMCGYREVDFALLDALVCQLGMYGSLDLIQVRDVLDEELWAAVIGVGNLHTVRLQHSSAKDVLEGLEMDTFQSLVMESRTRNATEADDRVFALMGVAPRQIREYMATVHGMAFNQGTSQLYTQFAKCMLENDPEWYFLSMAASKDRPVGLLSWVPNLNSQQHYMSRLAQPSSGFSAGISPETQHLISRSITTKELTARGFYLDTVTDIIPQTAFTDGNMKHSDMYGTAACEWDMNCIRLCQKVHGLSPEQLPTFHANILVAQSPAKPVMNGRVLEGYRVFATTSRMASGIFTHVTQGNVPVPEEWLSSPDGVSGFINKAVNNFRDSLSVEDYALLLQFVQTMNSACCGRPYISTQTALLGLGCPGIKTGDVICILYGTTVPYVLRPAQDGSLQFVGDAYIHGVMNGEALNTTGRRPDEVFRVV